MRNFRTQAVVTELINLRAILSLPKGTEHFVSDLHGESMAFIHMIKNASGVVRKKVDEVYGYAMEEDEKRALCALIYYPDERIEYERTVQADMTAWYKRRLGQVVEVARAVTIKYSRSKVQKLLPPDYAYIIGDIFDRGPGAAKIRDVLSTVRDYDIEWGNHDIEWMGAMAGNMALLATVLRVSIRYANIETLEEGYGINLLPRQARL